MNRALTMSLGVPMIDGIHREELEMSRISNLEIYSRSLTTGLLTSVSFRALALATRRSRRS